MREIYQLIVAGALAGSSGCAALIPRQGTAETPPTQGTLECNDGPNEACLTPGEKLELTYKHEPDLAALIINRGRSNPQDPYSDVEAIHLGVSPTPVHGRHYSFMGIKWSQYADGNVSVYFREQDWKIVTGEETNK